MKILTNIFLPLIILLSLSNSARADFPRYLDFQFILNKSIAGSQAQKTLKSKLENSVKSFNLREKEIQKEEKKIISQKKVITESEYKNKILKLREKVSNLRNDRNKILQNASKTKNNARNQLLKNLNPILKEFMREKNIRMVLDKKDLILADESLDITDDIMKIFNNKVKSIKIQ